MDGINALGGIYTPLNLELYEPDTPAKRASMLEILSESDYIVLPSNRAYDAMPRLPLRYPLTLKYYQALFDCNCDGNGLESRAAGLEAPFKSPLGFDLVATFESPPSLGPLVFPDQLADESFTVYDHPKVMVFKKNKDFSIARVSELLNSVDLNQVIFQTPKQYAQAPTALQLPADRLLAQTNGGTWSAMFNRAALININDVFAGVAWYVLIFFLGLLVFPFVFSIFSRLPDRGYPLIRIAGLILIAWMPWLLGSLKLMAFSKLTIWLCIILVLILSALAAYHQRKALLEYIHKRWKYILVTEGIFLILFLISLYIRLGNPDLWNPWLGGEKPMDFAFFNAVLKSVYFPPENPWFSGHTINYYYYGYVLAAIPTKLLGIIPSKAFNLILPSWFSMTGVGVFSVGYNLLAGLQKAPNQGGTDLTSADAQPTATPSGKPGRSFKRLPYLAGIIALVAVLFLGNLYEVRILWEHLPEAAVSETSTASFGDHVGAVIGGAIQVLTGQSGLPGGKSLWYFDATRPILHNGPDTPIAEFPYFTFLYGDLHAHLLTMPIYALALGWILSLLLLPASGRKWSQRIISLMAAGLIFGSFRASHTWDFPTFVGMGGLVILWDAWRSRTGSLRQTILVILGCELAFAGLSVAFYWPFTHWFHTEYVSIKFWDGIRTPLIDYLFVFGLPLFVMISLLVQDMSSNLKTGFQQWISAIKQGDFSSSWYMKRFLILLLWFVITAVLWMADYQVLALGIPLLIWIATIFFSKREMTALRRITWILFAIGLSITLFVEVFVLNGDTGRSNTVFKFYIQAWFIFGLALGLGLIELFSEFVHWPKAIKYVWGLGLGVLFLGAASYALIATGQKMTDRWPDIQNPPHSLDGAAFMLGDASNPAGTEPAIYNDDNRLLNLSHDYAAIVYMQEHVSGSPVIVEGHTEEYRWGSRFSIYTGLPSVVGWSWHIRQQDSLLDGAIIDKRIDEVNDFYNTGDIQTARAFLQRYKVQYIVVGDLERAYYDPEGIAKFQNMVQQGLLQIVFGDNTPNSTTIFKVVKL